MNITAVHSHIDGQNAHDLALLERLVAQPSISAQNIGVQDCANLIVSIMADMGMEAQVVQTNGMPYIIGELKSKNPKAATVLIYGHYDVQPPEPLDAWVSPPFTPTIRDGKLYGRGTGDNKGQFLAHLLALRSFLAATGDVPVNIKFLFDGEEESGSPNIYKLVEQHRDRLQADLVYWSDAGMHDSGAPFVYYGCRGMLSIEITLETARVDNHSGNKGGVIPNAGWEMVKLLHSMIDKDGNCAVQGFYDAVVPPSPYDIELMEQLPYNPVETAKVFGVKEINLSKQEFYQRIMFRPTFSINGLVSGYSGKGGKSVIPKDATVKIDMRLVPAQDPMDIFEKINAHVAAVCPDAKLLFRSGKDCSNTRTDLPISKVVAQAVGKAYGTKPLIMARLGATSPESIFTQMLGLPTICVPYANADEDNHAPNENIAIDCFYQGIHCTVEVLAAIAEFYQSN